MSVLAAVNFEDGMVLLEDGRELPITGYYANRGPGGTPLKATDTLLSIDRVATHHEAEVFIVDFPGADTALIVEMAALGLLKPSQLN